MTDRPEVRFLDRTTPPHIGTLILLAGISALCMNVFLPSLPGMAVYFDADYSLMQLSVAVYLAVTAVLQIIVGPISDKMGRRPVILWGVGLFLLATLGCIYAPNAQVFLAFRMAQAVVVAAMVLSRAVVRDIAPAAQAAALIGYVTMGMSIVPMIGPMIGGFLDSTFDWRASFWMLFILGLAILILTWFDLGETSRKSGLSLTQQFREFPELLTRPRFWGYSLASGLSSGAYFAYLGGAPFVATELFGLSPAMMGIYFGAPAVGYFLGNWASGRFSVRLGVNRMVAWGCYINAAGVAMSMVVFQMGFGTAESFFGFMTLVGIGNGMSIPNATAGALSVRPHLAGTASGLSGSIMLGGGAALSALAGALLTPGSGAYPLLWIMLATSAAAIGAITYVVWRERRLGL
jgi:DHA1 family bicyclomycin/chloramphenicol resistance-like MFS transporter